MYAAIFQFLAMFVVLATVGLESYRNKHGQRISTKIQNGRYVSEDLIL